MSSSTLTFHPSLPGKSNSSNINHNNNNDGDNDNGNGNGKNDNNNSKDSKDRTWQGEDHRVDESEYPPHPQPQPQPQPQPYSVSSPPPQPQSQPYPQPQTTSPSAITSLFNHNNLSPYFQLHSNSASPTLNNASTPADSLSAFSEHFSTSDLSDHADPFYDINFDHDGSTPAFLEDSSDHSEPSNPQTVASAPDQHAHHPRTYTYTPRSIGPTTHATSSTDELKNGASERLESSDSISSRVAPQLSPDAALFSEDGMGTESTTAPMPSPSPRVTVSMWGRDEDEDQVDDSFPGGTESPAAVRAAGSSADDSFISASYQRMPGRRDEQGAWTADPAVGPSGWNPENRPTIEGASINEIDVRRKISHRNQEVDKWITTSEGGESGVAPDAPPTFPDPYRVADDGIDNREIPPGGQTENKYLPGQTYYTEGSGPLTEEDFKLMRQHPLWSDAPTMHRITQDSSERQQPETSKAAMERFDQMCQDTGSVLSRTATWGTRRRSLPSIADIEGITSGSFLKKLSINRDRKPSILFKELRGLAKKPSVSQLLKRHRTVPETEGFGDVNSHNRRESRDTLAPPSRTTSWSKKQQMPSLNTALLNMATGAAAIGTTHARSGSISNVTSPKSPFNLGVKHTLRRPRSKSDLPKGGNPNEESHPNLVGMWKKSGGPPVAQLSRGASAPDPDEDDDDEEDAYNEEGDVRTGSNNLIDEITPNFAGFKQQVLQMNPRLAEQNSYLVDRIAHQQVVRYKALLNSKIKHMQLTVSHNCPSGQMCIALGGSAVPFDARGAESRGMDPLSTTYDAGSDGDVTPLEGAVTAESFPPDIPLPPTSTLPAEFECQLCYSAKKFTKPSDWTKHVHEDVQPFTCTWDRCREPKIFKRKADWVRHENEGHRHLEWWTCDVEDCRHTCYRRDNFLQHLVREHKFTEPKVKTKAAVKRAGAQDPTWQKVEQCHAETMARPQDEPCRFCGKMLPSWKKLTVHLAKHMETMSLPILRLVARKPLDADTIISPIQEPPPRSFPPVKSEAQPFNLSPNPGQSPGGMPGVIGYPNPPFASYNPSSAFPNFYDPPMAAPQPAALNLGLHQPGIAAGFQGPASYQGLPVSSGGYMAPAQYITMPQQMEPFPAYMNPLGLQDATGNQMYDTTALDPANVGDQQQQYSHQDSISPYSRSPHQGQGGFYHQQR